MSDATTTHTCPTCSHVHLPPDDGSQTGEPADVHMVKTGYTSERLFREVWEPQGWKRVEPFRPEDDLPPGHPCRYDGPDV